MERAAALPPVAMENSWLLIQPPLNSLIHSFAILSKENTRLVFAARPCFVLSVVVEGAHLPTFLWFGIEVVLHGHAVAMQVKDLLETLAIARH
jgi:hypothetical protein